ncbi:MAG: hypothetical protein U0165_14095 [Polyangiaceae bacterium]
MIPPGIQDLKKALIKAGFEVYRTRGSEIHLAERPRENLILDSGVSVVSTHELLVRFTVRAQRSDFLSDDDEQLLSRARTVAATALARGFIERAASPRPLFDPGEPTRVIDTWGEVHLEKQVGSLEDVIAEVSFALKLEKAASRLALRTSSLAGSSGLLAIQVSIPSRPSWCVPQIAPTKPATAIHEPNAASSAAESAMPVSSKSAEPVNVRLA